MACSFNPTFVRILPQEKEVRAQLFSEDLLSSIKNFNKDKEGLVGG